jgi:putative acetyltransferase
MSFEIDICPETAEDRAAISAVHDNAFGGTAEAELVDALRRHGDLLISLVARADTLIGHIAFSRLELPESPVRACALAPLAVVVEQQRQGIGAALVREGLRRLASSGEELVLVLGDPAYYGRFGFTAESAAGLQTPYDGPYLQALALSDNGRHAGGPVRYARAFEEL